MRLLPLLLALAALALAGCGDEADAPARSDGGDRLEVTREGGQAEPLRRELECAGADRDLCARIAALLPRLAPEPDEVCAEIYGGPERIVLRGRLGGEPVERELTRTNSCEIARYDLVAAILA